MKKYLLLFLTLLFLVLPLITSAEIKEGSFEIEPFAGFTPFASNDYSMPVYGLRVGYNITKNWGVEAAYNHLEHNAEIFQGNVLYHFMPDNKFNPFITAGLGHANVQPRYHGEDYNTIMGDIGIGAKYFITPNIALRADARDVITHFHNAVMTAGITFAFGGKTPKPAPEAPAPPPPPPPAAPAPEAPAPPPPPPPPPPAPKEVKIILEDVHFDFDKATLTAVAKEILDKNIQTLKGNNGINVQIEGHTCAHGTEQYNMALSERRAIAVKEYLVNAGISSERMTTISYGETRLAMPEKPTPKNKESQEAKTNRRVHFEVIVK